MLIPKHVVRSCILSASSGADSTSSLGMRFGSSAAAPTGLAIRCPAWQVPYFRQLLPVLNIFRNCNANLGDNTECARGSCQ